MTNKSFIINKLKERLAWMRENTDYNVAFICLQGSQNYAMDTKKSDVDVKCFIVPTLKDMVSNKKPVSKIYTMDDNSIIDVKDIRLLPSLLHKCNPSYLELLYSDYFLTNNSYHRVPTLRLKKQLKKVRHDICNRDVMRFMKCLKGNVHDRRKHMEKETETTAKDIEIYGYVPKDFHHLLRYTYMIEEINRLGKIKFESLMSLDFLTKPKFNELKLYKTNPVSKVEAIRLADMYVNKADRIVEEFEANYSGNINDEIDEKVKHYVNEYVEFCIERDVITEFVDKVQQKKLKEVERERS